MEEVLEAAAEEEASHKTRRWQQQHSGGWVEYG
jgi:hypothetical protein